MGRVSPLWNGEAPPHSTVTEPASAAAFSFAADQQVGVPVLVHVPAGKAAAEVVVVPGSVGDAGGVLRDVDVLAGQAVGGAEGEEDGTGVLLAADRL